MKLNFVRSTATVATATLLVGAVVGWGVATLQAHRDIRSLALAHELEATGLCVGGLNLERAQRSERLVLLLEQRLDSAVTQAALLSDEGARLGPGMPNLRDAVRRAASYYSTKGEDGKRQRVEELIARLDAAR